jgi:hypothetical protein
MIASFILLGQVKANRMLKRDTGLSGNVAYGAVESIQHMKSRDALIRIALYSLIGFLTLISL